MKKIKNFLIAIKDISRELKYRISKGRYLFVVLSMSLVLTVAISAIYVYSAIYSPSSVEQNIVINIEKGSGIKDIGVILEEKKLVSNPYIFVIATKFILRQDKLHYGEYNIPPKASLKQIIDILASAKNIMHNITFAEGMTSWEIVQKINAERRLQGHITKIPIEGTLMPETYSFTRNTGKQKIIHEMQKAQSKFIKDNWHKKQPNLPYKTPHQVIILASVVEKETGKAQERSKIAGVFVNRLRKGIRLQSDPTVVYGITKGKRKLGRGLLKSELRQKNQYNTYKIKGLPKTPIANPGKAAIIAVLQPEKTDALYFVSSGDGGHYFSDNYKQHQKYVRDLRKREKVKTK